MSNGNVNNNNTYNRYNVCGASESFPDCDGWAAAERSFYRNKHDSTGAQRVHLHPARVMRVARLVESGGYQPKPGYCFPLRTPSPREIYAAFCSDRLVHHYVAPFLSDVAEAVHNANGDVSHGNRKGRSAQTAAEQIRDAIVEARGFWPDPYVVKVDIRSFFASVPRDRAYKVLESFANEFYVGEDRARMLAICKTLILHDPVRDCVELPGDWGCVPAAKRLKNAKPGRGLPIGNFYSQIVANLYLAMFDALLRTYGVCPRFVDDTVGVTRGKEEAKAFVRAARTAARALGLELHPDKIYIQPARHGVNFCGRTVKGRRIYLSNRTVNRCLLAVRTAPATPEGARAVCATVNSCLGLMSHCTEYRTQRRLAEVTLSRFGEWLYFVSVGGKFTCRLKKQYTARNARRKTINNLIQLYHEISENHQRNRHPYQRGRRTGNH